jgi:sugar phosphate isomerase/epimerase
MSEWPIGLSTGCFYQTSIFECLEPIRDAGFSTIEVCSFPAHLDYHDRRLVERAGQRLQKHQLDPYSFHAPFADRIDITSLDSSVRQSSIEEILLAAEAAALMRVRHFVIHPGPEKGGFPFDQRLQRMENAAMALNQISGHCKRLGVRLVLENMLPHLFFGHTRDVLWVLGALESIDVGICLDTGHAYLSGDLSTVVHKLSGHLWMVHASDNRGRYDDHLPPGEGSIAWKPLIEQLRRLHFAGTFILEIAGDSDSKDLLARAQCSRQFLQSQWQSRA